MYGIFTELWYGTSSKLVIGTGAKIGLKGREPSLGGACTLGFVGLWLGLVSLPWLVYVYPILSVPTYLRSYLASKGSSDYATSAVVLELVRVCACSSICVCI